MRTTETIRSGRVMPAWPRCLPSCRVLVAAALLLALLPSPVRAVDGGVDVRADQQDGRAGASAFRTRHLLLDGRLEERIPFSSAFYMQFRYGAQREASWSRFQGSATSFETQTYLPGALLSMRAGRFALGLTADGLRKDYFGQGLAGRRDEQLSYGGWGQYDLGPFRFSGRWLANDARRRGADPTDTQKTDDRTTQAGVRFAMPGDGETVYGYLDNSHEDRLRDSRSRFTTHTLQYRGAVSPTSRSRFAWDAQARHFTERLTGPLGDGRRYLTPIDGGYTLDDTPLERDPLEGDVIGVPGLRDTDRRTATAINIGDGATTVHEFPGDYRNIAFDFGTRRELGTAYLYVDRIAPFPQLLRWDVYASDDPEGRLWRQVPADTVTVSYREWDASLRGWQFDFVRPLTARYLKVVDVKGGLVGDDLFVTELEVYDRAGDGRTGSSARLRSLRLDSEFNYRLGRNVSFRYMLHLDERRDDSRGHDFSGRGHQASLRWARRRWSLGSTFESSVLRSANSTDTDNRIWSADAGWGLGTPFKAQLSGRRQSDRSSGRDRRTDSVALQTSWDLLPGLQWSQKLSWSKVNDPENLQNARAWLLGCLLRAQPRPSVSLELRRDDRWVDQLAGSGFTPYRDTELVLRWSPWPLVSLDSQVSYQERERGEWLVRHNAVWTPLPGGSFELRGGLTDFHDTRTGLSQKGANAGFAWRARPRLSFEGSAEKTRFVQNGELSWPLSLNARGNWTF